MKCKISNSLPNFPPEIVKDWLHALSERSDLEWPPSQNNSWRYVLGKNRDLEYLQKLKWEKKELILTPNDLAPYELVRIVEMFKTHVLGYHTLYSGMTDGKERFLSCCEYLKKNGVFPKPIILEIDNEGKFFVLDGNHRLLAFFYLSRFFKTDEEMLMCNNLNPTQEVWVAMLE